MGRIDMLTNKNIKNINNFVFTLWSINFKAINRLALFFYVDRFIAKLTNYISVVGLPVVKKKYRLLRSPHVNKKSMERFEQRYYKCFVYFFNNLFSLYLRVLFTRALRLFNYLSYWFRKTEVYVFRFGAYSVLNPCTELNRHPRIRNVAIDGGGEKVLKN